MIVGDGDDGWFLPVDLVLVPDSAGVVRGHTQDAAHTPTHTITMIVASCIISITDDRACIHKDSYLHMKRFVVLLTSRSGRGRGRRAGSSRSGAPPSAATSPLVRERFIGSYSTRQLSAFLFPVCHYHHHRHSHSTKSCRGPYSPAAASSRGW